MNGRRAGWFPAKCLGTAHESSAEIIPMDAASDVGSEDASTDDAAGNAFKWLELTAGEVFVDCIEDWASPWGEEDNSDSYRSVCQGEAILVYRSSPL